MSLQKESTSIWIRKASNHDALGILECLRASFEVYRESYTPEGFADTVLTPGTLQQRLADMCIFVAVSASGEQIVGTVGCSVVDQGEGHIRGMAVRPAWHGSGIAAQLLKAVEAELREQKCSRITLDTTAPLKRAMRFYEKNGFRRSGKVTDFFGMALTEYVKTLAG